MLMHSIKEYFVEKILGPETGIYTKRHAVC